VAAPDRGDARRHDEGARSRRAAGLALALALDAEANISKERKAVWAGSPVSPSAVRSRGVTCSMESVDRVSC
jgi:hypothetical protein